jgi:hypothetical protein
VPGFVSYTVIKVNDGRLIAMGYFETREGAERMEELGAVWRGTIGKDDIISAVPHIGEIIFEAGPAAEEPRAASPELHAPL